MKTEVHNLATGESLSYSLPPREAVIAAYAQSRKDFNTWDYEKRYGKLVEKGRWSVLVGDWSAMTRQPSRKEIRALQKKRKNKVSEVIKVERSESSKFDDTLVERLHEMTLEGFAAEELGDVQDFGWYGLLLFGDDPITAEYDDESEKVAAAILTEDSQGFVYADTFTTEKEAKEQWSKIEDEYEESEKEAEEEEAEEEEAEEEEAEEKEGSDW